MRIGLFFSGLAGGGTQRRMLALARGFVARGHAVDLIIGSAEGPFRHDVPAGARLVPLASDAHRLAMLGRHRGLWVPLLRRRLEAWLEADPPDILMASSTPANLTAALARSNAAPQLPLVLVLNLPPDAVAAGLGPLSGRLMARLRRRYGTADALIAISEGIALDAERALGLDGHRIRVVANPVDAARIAALSREPVDHPWLEPGSPPVILAVGKLKPQKDFETLIRAFARLRRRRFARLVILGEGERRRRLERLARRLGLAGDVAFAGFCANPFAWMARAKLLVSSSRFEGFSNVLAEALACGATIVSTDCRHGPAEILDGGAHGCLVPVGDTEAMAEAMFRALDRPADPARQRARAERYGPERAVTGYLDVLTALARPFRIAA